MATYGYVRASTNLQEETLGVQERQIRGQAMVMGLNVDAIFIESGVSGSTPFADRPEGSRLLALVKPGDTIISPKLDRCFRSSLDALAVLERLRDQKVALHLIDLGGDVCGNGISKLVFTILSAVAEAERDRIRERITDTKRDQAARNRFLGGSVPFGYKLIPTVGPDGKVKGGDIVEDEQQQAAIVRMKELKGQGHSLRTISAMMMSEGITISHNAVKKIVA